MRTFFTSFLPFSVCATCLKLVPIKPMKMVLFICLAAALSAQALATDIILTDGRVLKDATVVSQTPRKVMIKHTAGLSSVAKELLPPALHRTYPVDEAAAQEAEKKAIVAQEAALKAQRTESERLALVRAQREETAAAYAADQEKLATKNQARAAIVKANARSLAERYFEKEYGWSTNGRLSAVVTIEEVRPVDEGDGRWFVSGQAVMKAHHSSTFHLGGDSAEEWREQYNYYQFSSQDRHSPSVSLHNPPSRETRGKDDSSSRRDSSPTTSSETNISADRHRSFERESHREAAPLFFPAEYDGEYAADVRYFQGYYSTEGSNPKIDITLR